MGQGKCTAGSWSRNTEQFEKLVALGRGMSDEEVVREVEDWLGSPFPTQESPGST